MLHIHYCAKVNILDCVLGIHYMHNSSVNFRSMDTTMSYHLPVALEKSKPQPGHHSGRVEPV